MLADQVDYVVGVDTHRDGHVFAVVVALTGAVVAQRSVATTARGYGQACRFAAAHAGGRRVWAVGTSGTVRLPGTRWGSARSVGSGSAGPGSWKARHPAGLADYVNETVPVPVRYSEWNSTLVPSHLPLLDRETIQTSVRVIRTLPEMLL